jgi:hypothetical protein
MSYMSASDIITVFIIVDNVQKTIVKYDINVTSLQASSSRHFLAFY